ncbi:hypothetical protein [Paucisalibacillus globulus]|uniref:hypothetical protein n=1 Tax=Paucisalibacillus globulus TaxID=351095 RepID=UPI0003F94BF5|nr:hypothetical protein [Paucisalibacillus globulus]
MNGSLKIFKARYERIMKMDPAKRIAPAERLMKDMEEVFEIPFSVNPKWEKENPEVIALYEKVNLEAI